MERIVTSMGWLAVFFLFATVLEGARCLVKRWFYIASIRRAQRDTELELSAGLTTSVERIVLRATGIAFNKKELLHSLIIAVCGVATGKMLSLSDWVNLLCDRITPLLCIVFPLCLLFLWAVSLYNFVKYARIFVFVLCSVVLGGYIMVLLCF